MKIPSKSTLLMGTSVVLAAGAGALGAVAIAGGLAGSPPTKTTTVNVGQGATGPIGETGPAGPIGPAGPAGPAGAGGPSDCPTGSNFEAVVLNAPGGQVEIWTCVKG
jgi:hypothetical protein